MASDYRTPSIHRQRAASLSLKSPMEAVIKKNLKPSDIGIEIDGCPVSLVGSTDAVILCGDFVELDSDFSFVRYVRLYLMSTQIVIAKRRTWRLKNSNAYILNVFIA